MLSQNMISGTCVFIHSHRVRDGKVEHGLVLYPGDRGQFKTEEAKLQYQELFKDKAPFLPYAEVGKKYAETIFTEEERREAILKHMQSKGWEPKEVNEEVLEKGSRSAGQSSVSTRSSEREDRKDGDSYPVCCSKTRLHSCPMQRLVEKYAFEVCGKRQE